jgi:hypothetical protein
LGMVIKNIIPIWSSWSPYRPKPCSKDSLCVVANAQEMWLAAW